MGAVKKLKLKLSSFLDKFYLYAVIIKGVDGLFDLVIFILLLRDYKKLEIYWESLVD